MAKNTPAESRRQFLKAVPAAVAGAVGATTLAQQQGPAGPVTPAIVDAAEKITGLEFHAAEERAIANSLNQNLNTYRQLRQVEIPPDVEVALVFKPLLAGKAPLAKGPATPGRAVRYNRPAAATLKRPANLEDVAYWPMTKLAALVERKLVTSTELTRMYLERLHRYQPKLNFAVTITDELALQQAAAADREIAAGKYKGPLHGIPWGGKDLLATKGIKTTWGAHPYMEQVFDFDATVVERLRDAGAVLVAKLTLGALAQGDQWFGGRTNNPWNPDDPQAGGASGSSAGPGSATAAGCVGFSIGTETRGSIISPTARNGVVGLRPTYGRVSRYGAMELSWTMDKIGPMCRSVEDCVLVLNAIYGPDGRDNSVADVPFTWNPDRPLSQMRIGYVRSDFEAAPEGRGGGGGRGGAGGGRGGGGRGQAGNAEARLKMMQEVLGVMGKLGAKLEPVDLPPFNANQLGFILTVEAAAAFDELTRSRGTDLMERSSWPATFRAARFVPAVEYLRAQRIRTMLMREWDTFMSQYDAFISSNGAGLAQTNLTGHPAIALKCGFINDMPQVLMVTGRLYDEATICRIAYAYEQATDWKDKHPTLG
jgi:Asp-tRNA(Asn)/Glu-tRNA(Gln) amidotransferase A subunit family amidase